MLSTNIFQVILLALLPLAFASPVQLLERDTTATNVQCTDKAA